MSTSTSRCERRKANLLRALPKRSTLKGGDPLLKGLHREPTRGGKDEKYVKIKKCTNRLEKKDLNLIPVRECTEKKSAQLLFFLEKMFLKRFLDLVSDTSDDAK